jgi:hypothetical protein
MVGEQFSVTWNEGGVRREFFPTFEAAKEFGAAKALLDPHTALYDWRAGNGPKHMAAGREISGAIDWSKAT